LDDDDDDDDSLLDFDPGFSKKPRSAASKPSTAGTGSTVIGTNSNQWLPMFLQSKYKDRMLRDHVTIAMALPSGLIADGLQGKLFPSVSNDGKNLTVKCAWPTLLYDTDSMEIGWSRQNGISTRELVNMVVAMEQEIKDHRKQLLITRGDQLTSMSTIKLIAECEREIVNMVTVTDRQRGGIVVYIVLKVRIEETEEAEIDMSVQDIHMLKNSGAQLSTKENTVFGNNNITFLSPEGKYYEEQPDIPVNKAAKNKRKCKSTGGKENKGKSQNYM
jgi:hypothetical protein